MSRYTPKWCRTRDCDQPFGHAGRCETMRPSAASVKVIPPSTRAQRRAARRNIERQTSTARNGVVRTESRESMERTRQHKAQRFTVTRDGPVKYSGEYTFAPEPSE